MSQTAKKLNSSGVVLTTISFYPEISGTGQILTDLAVALVERGMDVRVYTAQPHYYQKHPQAPKKEVYKGIKITRIPSTTFNKNFRSGRILNWLSFTLAALMALCFENSNYPLLIVSSPPILPFIGCVLKLLRRRSYILLIHDVYPDIGIQLGYFKHNGPTVRLWNALNRIAYSHAEKVIVLAEDMAEVVLKKMNGHRNANKLSIIHNWADETFIRPIERKENLFLKINPLPYKFIVQYAGNLGFNHELEPLIEAARRLPPDEIGFVFIGEGGKKEKLQSMVREYGLKNVCFFPFQPRELLPHTLSASNLSVVTLERGLEGFAVPSKFYSILASGKPILAILGKTCEMANLIQKYDCGFVVPQGQPDEIIHTLQHCLNQQEHVKKMGENARLCFEENFTRSQAASNYQSLIQQVAQGDV